MNLQKSALVPSVSRRASWLIGVLCLSLLSQGLWCDGPVWGQEATAQPDKPPAADPQKAAEALEKLIYIPYRNLAATFNNPEATIFLPYKEFEALWKAAAAKSTTMEAPVSAIITSAKYTGTVENSLARITAEYKLRVLNKPWALVPLQFGDAAVGKLTASHEQTALIGTGEGTYQLLLPTVGEHTVTLELVTRVRTATDGRNFQLQVPPVGITNLELTIPAADQTVEVLPHLVSEAVAGKEDETKVQAGIGSTKELLVRWYPRVSKTPEMELLTSVTNQLHTRVADGLVQTEAVLTYQVLRGDFQQAVIAVPLQHRILDVEAPNLKGWKVTQEPQRQVIAIDLLPGEEKIIPVTIRTERPITGDLQELAGIAEDGPVHGIHAIGAVRESGVLVVSHAPDLTLTVEQQRGLSRTEAQEVPEALRRDGYLYFKYFTPTFRLAVSAKPVEPRVSVTQHAAVTFRDDELKLVSHFTYTVERAGVFELRWNLPDGLKIQRVESPQKREYALTPDGKTLILTLNQKTLGAIPVEIHATRAWDSKAEAGLTLPLLEPLQTAREDGQLFVLAPQAFEVITDEAGLVGVQPERGDVRPDWVSGLLGDGTLRLVSTWTFNRRPVTVPVNVSRRPTRLTAQLTTDINVARETLEVNSRATYVVEYAGVDQFRIEVPEAIASAVQVEALVNQGAVPIKDQKRGVAVNGWIPITITTQREVVGTQIFQIKYDVPLTKQNKTASVKLDPVRVGGVPGGEMGADKVALTSLLAEIVVRKDRLWSLSATPKELQAIDIRELTLLPQEGALAYRYSRQPAELSLTATEHEIQQVVQTVISRMLVEAVITHEDAVTYRCQFQVQTSERQRLSLELPAQVQPLGVLVAGKQVQLERNPDGGSTAGTEAYYVNVARSGKSEESFPVTLVYRIPGKGLSNSAISGRLALHLPILGGDTASGNVAVQQARVAVWVPKHISLVGTPEHFTPEVEIDFERGLFGRSAAQTNLNHLDSWIGQANMGLFEFPTAGQAFVYSNLGGASELRVTWWRTTWVIWLWTVVLLIIAWLMRKTSWENRLGWLLGVLVLVVGLALVDPGYAVFLASMSRFGLVGMLGLWCLYALLTIPADAFKGGGSASLSPAMAVPYAVVPPPGVFDKGDSSSPPTEPPSPPGTT